jgi:methylglutaconyl-CoA hydratase
MYHYIETEIKERIAYLILNRIDKKNALNFDFVKEIKTALNHWKSDNEIKVVIIKANGDVFSAGADLDVLKQLQVNTYEENLEDSRHLKELFEIIATYPKVVISQVEGHAIAGGCGLATICDFCFAVPEAQFGYTEVKIGFIPALVSIFLVRKIGEMKAKELLLTGKLIAAQKAFEMGLINEPISKQDIGAHVYEFALKLAIETSLNSIGQTKALIAHSWHLPFLDAMDLAAQYNATSRASSDCKKGIQAFLNKEKISW